MELVKYETMKLHHGDFSAERSPMRSTHFVAFYPELLAGHDVNALRNLVWHDLDKEKYWKTVYYPIEYSFFNQVLTEDSMR